MAEYWDRDFKIQVGPRLIEGRDAETGKSDPTLRCSFKIEKELVKKPNNANLTVHNLSNDSVAAIKEKGALVIIEAGYVGHTKQLFKGDLKFSSTKKVGTERISSFQSGDGLKQYSTSTISENLPSGTDIRQAIKTVAAKLGLDFKKAAQEIDSIDIKSGAETFLKGLNLHGRCSDQLDKLVRSAGLEWSIQDGELQILGLNKPTNAEAVVLSEATGLIGTPEIGEDGIVKAKSFLNGEFSPGGPVFMDAENVDGLFRILSVTHMGDTWANPWYSDLEITPL